MRRRSFALAALALACTANDAEDARTIEAPSAVVDSVLAPEIALARFRHLAGDSTDTLRHAAESRDELVRQFMAALLARDSGRLSRLAIDRAEYAWLYYPTSLNSRPPYLQDPALGWFLLGERSQKGIMRAARLVVQSGAAYAGYQCAEEQIDEGANALWLRCVVLLQTATGDTAAVRLFGSILERDGRYKFLSYANGL